MYLSLWITYLINPHFETSWYTTKPNKKINTFNLQKINQIIVVPPEILSLCLNRIDIYTERRKE